MLQVPSTLGGAMLHFTPVTLPPSTDAHSASEQQLVPPAPSGGTHCPLHNRELVGQPHKLLLHICPPVQSVALQHPPFALDGTHTLLPGQNIGSPAGH
jgi:hypothetical protein